MNRKNEVQTMLTRRQFLLTSASAFVSAMAPFSLAGLEKSSRRPNVLILLSDQETERISRSWLRLPNRRRLEARGMRFTNAFCATPQCSASRASLLTGLNPHQAGVVANVDSGSLGKPLSPSIPCLGSVFRDQGYIMGYLGKWHLGNDENGLGAFGFPNKHDGSALRGEELANAAADWIRNQEETPWLLVVSFINPHDIYQISNHIQEPICDNVTLPDNFHDDLAGKPAPQRQYLEKDQGKVTLNWGKEEWLRYRSYYLNLIEKVDSHIGIILDALEAKGQSEDTVAIYSSDHGDMAGAHRLPFKGPFMYDELLNVPLTLSYPQRFAQGGVSDSLVSLIDIVPTLCEMSGIAWPKPLPGISLCPLFSQPNQPLRKEIYAEYYGKQKWINPINTIRTKEWKYNLYLQGGEELYALDRDPGEIKNLAADSAYAPIKKKLADSLQRFHTH
ncbi:MAG: sulfatase-like hydrolase/transferase [Candidatus Omnitrophota bacterium]